jgi:hypothetical protein
VVIYLSFHNSSFALKIPFNVNGKAMEWHTLWFMWWRQICFIGFVFVAFLILFWDSFPFVRDSSRNLDICTCVLHGFLKMVCFGSCGGQIVGVGLELVEQLLGFGGHCLHVILFKIKQVYFSYFMLKPWVQNPTTLVFQIFDYRNGTRSGSLFFYICDKWVQPSQYSK